MIKSFLNSLSRKDNWLTRWLNGDDEGGKKKVTTTGVIGLPPVWYAVNKIAGHIGIMPLAPRKRTAEGGSKPAKTHPAYRLTKKRPNRNTNAFPFWETMIANSLLVGRSVAAVIRDDDGKPIELIPFVMSRTAVAMVNGEKWFGTYVEKDEPLEEFLEDGNEAKPSRKYYWEPDRNILDVPGLSLNGVDCLSLVKIASEAFDNSLNGQAATNKNFRNPRPGLMIEAPVGMFRDQEEAKEFIDSFNEDHSGLDEQGKAGLLREGMTVSASQITGKDSQWIEQRKFERQEIALLFMLEQILGDDSSVSYKSLEQKNLAYLMNCLLKWVIKIEQECDEKLLSERQKQRDTHYFKMNVSALLRADSKTQMETVTGYILARVMCPNEARLLLDMNPYEGGDEFANPSITPGAPGEGNEGSSDELPDDDDEKESTVNSTVAAAVRSRLSHLASVEANRICDATKKPGINFVNWADSFYTGWQVTLGRAIDDLGGDRETASHYCDESLAALLDLSGIAMKESTWQDAVEDMVRHQWQSRVDELINAVADSLEPIAAI